MIYIRYISFCLVLEQHCQNRVLLLIIVRDHISESCFNAVTPNNTHFSSSTRSNRRFYYVTIPIEYQKRDTLNYAMSS